MTARFLTLIATLAVATTTLRAGAPQDVRAAATSSDNRIVTEANCVAPPLVATIPVSEIGERVRSVTLQAAWVAATDAVPAHCRVDGVFAPIDTAPTARLINFRVILPASWNRRGAQIGGGGINGIIPNLTGGEFGAGGSTLLQRGFATYGSDSGHQLPAFGRRGGPPPDRRYPTAGIVSRCCSTGWNVVSRPGCQSP
jgi:feruloyl esterase